MSPPPHIFHLPTPLHVIYKTYNFMLFMLIRGKRLSYDVCGYIVQWLNFSASLLTCDICVYVNTVL